MAEKMQKRYFRFDRAERASIERGLDKKQSARSMARDLGRAPASITDEAKRNRTVAKGPGRGGRVEGVPGNACARLAVWPWTCNGCKLRRYHCTKKWRCEYSAARAQALADDLPSEARKGVNKKGCDFERTMAAIRSDVTLGLSPAQIEEPEGLPPSALFGYLRKRLPRLRCSDDFAIQPISNRAEDDHALRGPFHQKPC